MELTGPLQSLLSLAMFRIGFLGVLALLIGAVALALSVEFLRRDAGRRAFGAVVVLALLALVLGAADMAAGVVSLHEKIATYGAQANAKDLGFGISARAGLYYGAWLAMPAQLLALHGLLRPRRRRSRELDA